MATNQEVIDQLIDYIDKAILKNSVSNRQVAAVLSFLNEAIKAMPSADIEELSKTFLRRDQPDSTEFLITFIKGLKSLYPIEVGEIVDSMTDGSGTLITPNKIQTERLEVRGSATFMEVILNRLSAVEGDMSFSASGTVEEVTEVDELTYRLKMRKRWDTDFTAFEEGDVIYGVVNDLFTGGAYYKVWLRVMSRDLGSNELIAVMYAHNMVPGGANFSPVAGMNVALRGNDINEDRQSCWYISTTEGAVMYLTGITKPILEEHNYSLILGRPKQLELFNGLPLNYNHPYLFARGAIIQDLFRIDYQGNPEYQDVDRGLWLAEGSYINGYNSETKRYERHQAWHESCLWRCVINAATIGLEPRFNNTEWTCILGDKNFSIEIQNTNKLVRLTDVTATLNVVVRHGTMDVTGDVISWEWTRSSGLPAEDNLWAIERQTDESVLQITNADMASNWLNIRKVSFQVRVTLLPGTDPLTAAYEIN